MARKKTKKHRRRTRRMSGTGGFDFMSPLLALGGGVGTKLLDHLIPDTVEGKTSAMIKVAAGVALPMLAKDAKTKAMLQNVGNGMVAVAGVQLLTEMEILSDDVFDEDEDMEYAVEVPDRTRQRKRISADVLGDDDDDDDADYEEMNADVLGDDDLDVINDDDLDVINDELDDDHYDDED